MLQAITIAKNTCSSFAFLLYSSPSSEICPNGDLEGCHNVLTHERGIYFGILLAMTLAVLVGLVLEYWEISHETRRAVSLCRKERPKEREIRPWKTIVGSIGWVLIVLGVGGEFVFEELVNWKDGQLQTINEKMLGDTRDAAGRAEASAHNATGDAAQAKIDAGKAKTKADAVDVASGEATRKSKAADKAASEALTRLGTVKWYVDILATAVNPRMLDRKVFLAALDGKPKGFAEIWYEPNDPEAEFFATQIHNFLGPQGAGWQVEDVKPLPEAWDSNNFVYGEHMSPLDRERIEANVNSVAGVQITGNKFFPPDREGKTAFGALTWAIIRGTGEFNFASVSTDDPSLPDDHFVILVGHHRVNIPVWKAPWQNPPPVPINTKHASTQPANH